MRSIAVLFLVFSTLSVASVALAQEDRATAPDTVQRSVDDETPPPVVLDGELPWWLRSSARTSLDPDVLSPRESVERPEEPSSPLGIVLAVIVTMAAGALLISFGVWMLAEGGGGGRSCGGLGALCFR